MIRTQSLGARLGLAAAAACCLLGNAAGAMTIEINEFLAPVAMPAPDVWYASDIRGAGTASIPNLTGAGGDLEANQPLPTGAALITTGGDTGDKAEVATFADFGDATTVLTTGTFGYEYYKSSVGDLNAFAAPALKISLFADGGTGDNFGTLVYEPNWNQGTAGSSIVPTDSWQGVEITSTTGEGSTATGGWWWTGGFDEPNTAGGPPLRSLAEWAALFNSNDPTDFANARVVSIAVGVGTFNLGQTGYFDEVSISVPGGVDRTFDFQAIPEPSALALIALGSVAAIRRRR